MNDMEPLSRKGRKLSRFLVGELLYDYHSGSLTPDRKLAVTEAVKSDKDIERELEDLKRGIALCDRLARLEVDESYAEKVRNHKTPLRTAAQKMAWREWPEFLKWGVEALAISLVAAIFAIAVPWSRLSEMIPKRASQILLLEVPRLEERDPKFTADVGLVRKDETPAPTPVPTQTPTPTPTPNALSAPAPAPLATKSPQPPPIAAADVSDEEESTSHPAPSKGNLKGFIYRGFMSLSDIEQHVPQITQDIIDLGGEKAGQVELGWQRPMGNYYHFTLPEDKYDQLLEDLKAFGPVRIYKEPHARVMPKGTIRIILWVEDARSKKQN